MSNVINLDILKKKYILCFFKHSVPSSLSVFPSAWPSVQLLSSAAPKLLFPLLTPVCLFLPIPLLLSFIPHNPIQPLNITASIPRLLVFNLLHLHWEYLFHFYLFTSPHFFSLSQFTCPCSVQPFLFSPFSPSSLLHGRRMECREQRGETEAGGMVGRIEFVSLSFIE